MGMRRRKGCSQAAGTIEDAQHVRVSLIFILDFILSSSRPHIRCLRLLLQVFRVLALLQLSLHF